MAKCLSKLYANDNNITVIKFLNTIPDKIPDISKIDPKNFIAKECPPLLPNKEYIDDRTQSNDDNHTIKNGRKLIKHKTQQSKNQEIKKEI